MLTWAARAEGRPFRPFGPPWRHLTLPRERATVRLDLRIADGWSPDAEPVLGLTGAGRVVVHAMRVAPARRATRTSTRAALDRALRWAPESIGHTTINLLTPSFWSASRGIWLADVVAGAAALVFARERSLATRLRGRRVRPGLALAAAALLALGAWNVHLARPLPPGVEPPADAEREDRIRENYYVAPDVGALAALARATLRQDERVGAMGHAEGVVRAADALLQPRAAALRDRDARRAGARRDLRGGRLRDDELDAIVAYRAGPLPDGFVPVAALGPSAVVARRRR